MKFLLELVSCCGCQEKGGVGSKVPPLESEEPMTEETRSLVASVSRSYRRKKRGKFGAGGGGGGGGGGPGSADWKPSLYAISEDNVVMEKNKSETERLSKRKSGGGSHKARTRVRSYTPEFRGNSVPSVIPAFSPTPFMF